MLRKAAGDMPKGEFYPLVASLEQEGLVRSSPGDRHGSGRGASDHRFYSLTPKGREAASKGNAK